jgi:DNA ligase (NAD+)
MSTENKIQRLTDLLEEYNYQYYVLDNPSVPDSKYEQIFQQLQTLEKSHPEYLNPNSPTQEVGGLGLTKFEQVKHQLPMHSLDNVFSEQALPDFIKRVTDRFDRQVAFCLEPKLDGLAASLIYEKGLLMQVATCGDGQTFPLFMQNHLYIVNESCNESYSSLMIS